MTQTLNLKPFAILALILIVFGVVLPPLNGHAVERHADQAIRAWNHVRDNGGPGDKWECPDGRTRWICALTDPKSRAKGLFAVVVISAAGGLITAFICRKDYASSIAAQSKCDFHIDHP